MTGRLEAPAEDVDDWAADVDALLAERDRVPPQRPATLPAALSVSSLVELGRDPDAAVRRLRRRLPVRPDPHALLGTAFHDWVQRFYGAERLFDLDDLPGAVDGQLARDDAEGLAELQAAFMASPWAARTPVDVEVPFDMVIGGTGGAGTHRRGVRPTPTAPPSSTGRRVNRRTRRRPSGTPPFSSRSTGWRGRRCAACPPHSVRAAFHYVRSGQTVTPRVAAGGRRAGRAAGVTRRLGRLR